MRVIYFAAAFIAMAMVSTFAARYVFAPSGVNASGSEFVSGPQVGSKVPGPFEPFNINGKSAGDEACFYCDFGDVPVAMIFAAKPSDNLTAYLKPIEKAAVEEAAKEKSVGACLIIAQRNDEIKSSLNKLADRENYKQVRLGMIEAGALKRYQLHPDADVTVLLYSKRVVRVNHAYKAGEFTEQVAQDIGTEAANFLAGK